MLTVETDGQDLMPGTMAWLEVALRLGIGGLGLLLGIACVWAVIRGHLIPRSIHESMIEDRNYWREAAMAAMGQNSELLPGVKIATQIAEALHDHTRGRDGS